jgi:hypothetical protein
MTQPWKIAALGYAALLAAAFCCAPAQAQVALDEGFTKEPSWKIPSTAEVRTQVFAWLDERKPSDDVRKQVDALWTVADGDASAAPAKSDNSSSGAAKNGSPKADEAKAVDPKSVDPKATEPKSATDPKTNPPETAKTSAPASQTPELLSRVAATMALVDPSLKPLVELCGKPHGLTVTPEFPMLADDKAAPFVRNNLRLLFGQWLTQEHRYDEALEQLKDLQPTDVVDPASLLFYQSVCYQWTLHKTEGLASISKLLEQRKAIPRRYQQLADLMQTDLNDLENESLDHISRRMNDVTRRLDFAHAGKQVRGVEDGIIDSLDKMIKDLEDQANQRQQRQQQQRQQGQRDGQRPGQRPGQGDQDGEPQEGQPGDPRGNQSLNPAQVSRAAKARGTGDVKSKNIGSQSGWGDLPAKEREEAMQQISKEFPSHYRDIIEQYFRKLASEEEDK